MQRWGGPILFLVAVGIILAASRFDTLVYAAGFVIGAFVMLWAVLKMVFRMRTANRRNGSRQTGQSLPNGFAGVYALRRSLYARTKWEPLSRLSLAEREAIVDGRLWTLRDRQKVVGFLNSKGGSAKTALTVWLSALDAWIVKRLTIAFDANENTGHTARRFGILRRSEASAQGNEGGGTIELREYLNSCPAINKPEDLYRVADTHRETGVVVIASNTSTTVMIQKPLFKRGLRKAKRLSNRVFVDCGNGVMNSTNLGTVEEANTLVFTGNTGMADSLPDILHSRGTVAEYGFPDKVDKSICVIVGASEGDRQKLADEYGIPIDRLYVVPRDPYMMQGKQPVSLPRLRRLTRVVLKEILAAILEAEESHDPVDSEKIPVIQTGTDAAPSQGTLPEDSTPSPATAVDTV